MHYDQWKLQPPPYMCESADACEKCDSTRDRDMEQLQEHILDVNDDRLLCSECIDEVNEQYLERISSVDEVI